MGNQRTRMPDQIHRRSLPWLWRLWIAYLLWATASMGILSAGGWLTAEGYLAAAATGVALGGWFWRPDLAAGRWRPAAWRRRWRRPAPLAFAVLTLVILGAAVQHPPNNYDTHWYRLPRIFHWLAEQRWHWIGAAERRLDVVTPGIEFLWCPLLAWQPSGRTIFLPNFVAFLLLPGTAFSFFRSIGVRARTAWWWMWLLPAGAVYIFQAGSSTNDAISAPLVLMSFTLALWAGRTGSVAAASWSTLAIALATNQKQPLAALGLPWLLSLWPFVRRFLPRLWHAAPLRTMAGALGVLACALLVSMVPISILNQVKVGNWMGFPPAEQWFVPKHVGVSLVVAPVMLTVANLLPPIMPDATRWNEIMRGVMTGKWSEWLDGFEYLGFLPRSCNETNAGIGVLTILLVVLAFRARPSGRAQKSALNLPRFWIAALTIASIAVLVRNGNREPARYFAGFYPLWLAVILGRPQLDQILRVRWWRKASITVTLIGAVLVANSPSRPLIPARWIGSVPGLARLGAVLEDSYAQQRSKAERMVPFLPYLKAGERIGFAGHLSGEIVLWGDHFSRQVVPITRDDDAQSIRRRGLRHAIVDDGFSVWIGKIDGLDWAESVGGRVIAAVPLSPAAALARRGRDPRLTVNNVLWWRAPPPQHLPANNCYLVEFPE